MKILNMLVTGLIALFSAGIVTFLSPRFTAGIASHPEVHSSQPQSQSQLQEQQQTENNMANVFITGRNYSFSPREIRVRKGDIVKITLTNETGTHDLVIDEFEIKTSRLPEGKSEAIQFIADKVGTFEYYCSIGNQRQLGMRGELIVE